MIEGLKRLFGIRNATAPNAYHRDDDPRLWQYVGENPSPLTFSAYWRGVSYLSGVIGSIPWTLQRVDPRTEAKERFRGHAIDTMLAMRANPLMAAITARRTMIAHTLTHGAAYAEIQRNLAGEPIAYWPITPDRVENRLAPDRSLVHLVRNSNGDQVPIFPENMLHFPGLGFDGVNSYSVVEMARRTIAAGVSGDKFARALWDNSAMIGGLVSHPETLSDTAWNRLRKQFTERYVGSQNRGKPIIGEEGLTFTPFAIPPEDAQFLENRQFTIEDMARWLGIPPHKMMDNRHATFSNVEEQNLEVIGDTMIPMIELFEQEANYKLLGPKQKSVLVTEMDIARLARGNFKARAEWLRAGFDMGGVSPDDVAREFGNRPTPGGNHRFVQMNLQTVSDASKPKQLPPAVAPGPRRPDTDPAEEVEDPTIENLAIALLETAGESVSRVHQALAKRHGSKPADVWSDKTRDVMAKSIVRIEPIVVKCGAAYGLAEADLSIVAETITGDITDRFIEQRKVISVVDFVRDALGRIHELKELNK